MRKPITLIVVSFFAVAVAFGQNPGDCTIYNYSWQSGNPSGTWVYYSDNQEHSSGDHHGTSVINGTCTYSGANISGYCSVVCSATTTRTTPTEWGTVNLYYHFPQNGYAEGGSSSGGGWVANAPTATCGGQFVVGVNSCLTSIGCGLTVSISASGNGLGGGVSWNPNHGLLWTSATYSWPNTCNGHFSPGCVPNDANQPPPQGENGYWQWNVQSCKWVWHIFSNSTPIIIDTDGSGFHLTSAAEGVKFDFYGNGHPIQLAWTAAGSTNGWLAIDLNGNGKIDSAQELFSNAAAQPANTGDPNAPDGFNDLSQYDSNHDGVIDNADPVWPRLLVWIDSNHDGISQPSELNHLDDVGIHSISTKYSVSPQTDQYGNQFHLKGHLNPDKSDSVDRIIYDVYLAAAQNQETAKK